MGRIKLKIFSLVMVRSRYVWSWRVRLEGFPFLDLAKVAAEVCGLGDAPMMM